MPQDFRGRRFGSDVMLRVLSVAFALITQLACSPNNADLRRELQRESERAGLALIEVFGRETAVIPFDGQERYYTNELGDDPVALFGNGGTVIAWYTRSTSSLNFRRVTDNATTVEYPVFPGFWPVALNEQADRLVFETADGSPTITNLRWSTMEDLRSGGLVTGVPPGVLGSNMTWSSDGRTLAYEVSNQIYLFDTTKNSSRLLVRGHDPAWSPDGRLIAYRSIDKQASLITPDGTPVVWPGGLHRIVSAARWSPDSRYVIFSEYVSRPIPIIGAYYRLVVCRMSDGATVAVRDFGFGSVQTDNFRWILSYRNFCVRCLSAQPFN
jgi:hypothetical protein